MHRNSIGDTTGTSKACTIQIAPIDSLDSLKCIMLLVFNATTLPNEFLELLETSDLKIVRVSVSGDISKTCRDFRYENVTKNLKKFINLGNFAGKRNVMSNGVVNLKR